MITVKEFMDCYNAALAGKEIIKKTRKSNYIEDSYIYSPVDFLNLNLNDVVNHSFEVEYFVNENNTAFNE